LGPLARTVADLRLLLPLIAGPDGRDPALVPMPLGDPETVPVGDLRVAIYTDNGIATPTPETVQVVERATQVLDQAGAVVTVAVPPGIKRTSEVLGGIWAADGLAWVRLLLDRAGTTEPHPQLAGDLAGAVSVSAAELTARIGAWDDFKQTMLGFMEDYDLILGPVNAFPALEHHQWNDSEASRGFSYTMTYSLTGWPAVVVRGGTSPEGLPIGVQIVARPWREDVALAAAQVLEDALGGWQRPPL
jgi:amidase